MATCRSHALSGLSQRLAREQTGLDYMFARYYDSGIAKFLSKDPGGSTARRLVLPMMFNQYGYVESSPVNAVDPDGRATHRVSLFPFVNVDPGSPIGFSREGSRSILPAGGGGRMSHDFIAVTDSSGAVIHTYNWNSTENPNWVIDDAEYNELAAEAIEIEWADQLRGDDLIFE